MAQVTEAQVERIKELLAEENNPGPILANAKSFLQWLEKRSKSIWQTVKSAVEDLAAWLDKVFS